MRFVALSHLFGHGIGNINPTSTAAKVFLPAESAPNYCHSLRDNRGGPRRVLFIICLFIYFEIFPANPEV